MEAERDLASDPRPGDEFRAWRPGEKRGVEIRVVAVEDGEVEFLRYAVPSGDYLGELRRCSILSWADRVGRAIAGGLVEEKEDFRGTEKLVQPEPPAEGREVSTELDDGGGPPGDAGREEADGDVEPAS